MADLEAEAVLLLRGFCIPPLEEAFPRPLLTPGPPRSSVDPLATNAEVCGNPEEIQLPSDEDEEDEDEENPRTDANPEEIDLPSGGSDEEADEEGGNEEGNNEAPKKYRFESFGLGSLVQHPAVLHYFQPSPALIPAASSSTSEPFSSAPGTTTAKQQRRQQQRLPTASELFPYLLSFRGGSREGHQGDAAGSFEDSSRAGVRQKKRQRGNAGGAADVAGERGRGPRDEAALAGKFGEYLAEQLGVEDIREVMQ